MGRRPSRRHPHPVACVLIRDLISKISAPGLLLHSSFVPCAPRPMGLRLLLPLLVLLLAPAGQALRLPPWVPLRGGEPAAAAPACAALFGAGAGRVTVLMVADPGHFSGLSEAHYFLERLEGAEPAPPGAAMCHSVVRGSLLGQPVAVVTSGIGQRSAAVCAGSLLMACPARIRELLFFGTAGCSLQRGGVLNADDCGTPNPSIQVGASCGDAGACLAAGGAPPVLACAVKASAYVRPASQPRAPCLAAAPPTAGHAHGGHVHLAIRAGRLLPHCELAAAERGVP